MDGQRQASGPSGCPRTSAESCRGGCRWFHSRELVGPRKESGDLSRGRGDLREPRCVGLQAGGGQDHLRSPPPLASISQARCALSKGAPCQGVGRAHTQWGAPFEAGGFSSVGAVRRYEGSSRLVCFGGGEHPFAVANVERGHSGQGAGEPSNRGMKQTKPERIGASQLIRSVRQT